MTMTKNNLEALEYQYHRDVALCWNKVMQYWMTTWNSETTPDYPITWKGLYKLLEDSSCEPSVVVELKRAVRRAIRPPVAVRTQPNQPDDSCNSEDDDAEQNSPAEVWEGGEDTVQSQQSQKLCASVGDASQGELSSVSVQLLHPGPRNQDEAWKSSSEDVQSLQSEEPPPAPASPVSPSEPESSTLASIPDYRIVLPIVLLHTNCELSSPSLAIVEFQQFYSVFKLCWFSRLVRLPILKPETQNATSSDNEALD